VVVFSSVVFPVLLAYLIAYRGKRTYALLLFIYFLNCFIDTFSLWSSN